MSATAEHEHKLKPGALGLFDSAVMGVAGSAPAYSIAATTFALFGAVALGGPAMLLYSGFFMFGIVFAFNYLSRDDQHAGASYSWVRRAIHPYLGFLSGWAVTVSALIFMVVATFPAGSTILSLFSSSAASNKALITTLGAVFFLLMVAAVAAGVTVTVTVQIIMSTIEVFLLLLFAILALLHHHTTKFSWSWFSPAIFHSSAGHGFSMAVFTGGALLGAFYYWGWDVTANLNEETKNAHRVSGLGGILGALVVFLLFEVFTIASNLVLTSGQLTNPNNAADILAVLGQTVWHGVGGKLIVLAVLLSTVATLETTLIQVTRTLFTMGRDNTLPKTLGTVHRERKTPMSAIIFVTVISLILFIGSQYVGSVANILTDGYNAIGIQICFYYALAGLAVVVLYRRQIFKSATNFIFMGLWPLVGAIFMVFVLVKDVPTLNSTTKLVGIGAMVLGLIPMAWYAFKKVDYFKMPAKEDRVAVLREFEQTL